MNVKVSNSIVLSMIVKDEAAVIARCLESVKPLLSSWVVVDTGSMDETKKIVQDVMRPIPGQLVERPWKNFGHNRSEALALSRDKGDYSLVIDADDTLEFGTNFELPKLTLDAYRLQIRYGTTSYDRVQVLKNAREWRYEGVIHEYPACDGPTAQSRIDGITYVINRDGARAKDPERFARDAELIEGALEADPKNTRYMFYLGQSYRDAKLFDKALSAYERRAQMGGWEEEVYLSLYEAARLREWLERPFEEVHAAYLRAHEARPRRAEALCELARYCRIKGRLALAFTYASAAANTRRPDDILFVVEAVYRWRAKDELAIAAYHTGQYELGRAYNEALLASPALPAAQRPRIQENLGWCQRALTRS